jgi:cytochrome P450
MMAPEVDIRARSHENVRVMMRALIEQRQVKRENDLVSRLLDMDIDGRPPTMDELESYCLLLFAAGLDTVANVLAFTMSHLASHPQLQDRLRADSSLIPTAAEEFLRKFAPTSPPRTVTRDAEFGGVRLKKGERVVLFLPACNYDPAAFADPDDFDLSRAGCSHVTFNSGPHLCAGRHLARLEIKVMLEEWLARMPNVRHDPAAAPEYRLGLTLACVKLPLVWDKVS